MNKRVCCSCGRTINCEEVNNVNKPMLFSLYSIQKTFNNFPWAYYFTCSRCQIPTIKPLSQKLKIKTVSLIKKRNQKNNNYIEELD